MSPCNAQQRKALCTARLENAQLKRVVSEKETEIAQLMLQLNAIKSKLNRADTTNNAAENLQKELTIAHENISQLKSQLKQARPEVGARDSDRESLEEQNEALREELAKCQSDLKIAKAAAEASSAAAQSEDRRAIRQLQQEADALKLEVVQLQTEAEHHRRARVSEKECSARQCEIERLQNEVRRLRQNEADATKATARTLKKNCVRMESNLMHTLELIQSKCGTAVENLDLLIGTLRMSVSGPAKLRTVPLPVAAPTADSENFMAQLARGIKSIEKLSQQYAKSRTPQLN
jgi:chromosome segregation ATPase